MSARNPAAVKVSKWSGPFTRREPPTRPGGHALGVVETARLLQGFAQVGGFAQRLGMLGPVADFIRLERGGVHIGRLGMPALHAVQPPSASRVVWMRWSVGSSVRTRTSSTRAGIDSASVWLASARIWASSRLSASESSPSEPWSFTKPSTHPSLGGDRFVELALVDVDVRQSREGVQGGFVLAARGVNMRVVDLD